MDRYDSDHKWNKDLEIPNYMKTKSRSASNNNVRNTSTYRPKSSNTAKPSTHIKGNSKSSSAQKIYKNTTTTQRKSGSSNNTGTTTKSIQKKKKKKKRTNRRLGYLTAAIFVVFIIAMLVVFIPKNNERNTNSDFSVENSSAKFADGIVINGVSVEGKTQSEAKKVVEKALEEQLSQIQITLKIGSNSWPISYPDLKISTNLDKTLNNAIKVKNSNDDLVFSVEYTVDRNALQSWISSNLEQEINAEAINPYATATLDENHKPVFEFHDGTAGRKMNVSATVDDIAALIEAGHFQKSVDVKYDEIAPDYSLEYIKQNTEFIAQYTTTFSNAKDEVTQNRVFNIKKASDIINGIVVLPGVEWSFNDTEGPRTYELGWKGANGISGGDTYTIQAGGGICQVSTTLYNALLCGDIEITERRKHSIPSSYVEKGLDATVDTSGIDLKFRNDTQAPLYIFSYLSQNPKSSRRMDITVMIYGTPLEEGVTYKTRGVIVEQAPLDEMPVYKEDPNIPIGYQLTTTAPRDRIIADAFQDKYVNGKLVEENYLYTDTYRGNIAKISIGTGDPALVPIPDGAEPVSPVNSSDAPSNDTSWSDIIPEITE